MKTMSGKGGSWLDFKWGWRNLRKYLSLSRVDWEWWCWFEEQKIASKLKKSLKTCLLSGPVECQSNDQAFSFLVASREKRKYFLCGAENRFLASQSGIQTTVQNLVHRKQYRQRKLTSSPKVLLLLLWWNQQIIKDFREKEIEKESCNLQFYSTDLSKHHEATSLFL